jgi:aryl-phospho-beta-D-glucosidase BglC (GH1 family)
MKLNIFYKIVLLLIVTGFSVSCSNNGDIAPQLSVSVKTVSFDSEGGTSDSITIEANSKWSISNTATSWLQSTQTNGNGEATVIKLTALSNEAPLSRSATLSVNADNCQVRRITVTQLAQLYPSYNLSPIAPDSTGMSSNAWQLAAKIQTGMGINFGNTMESPQEGDWQNSKLTESYVKYVKSLGFNSVRLPCNWVWTHLSDRSKAKIDPAWLARVKEVVG